MSQIQKHSEIEAKFPCPARAQIIARILALGGDCTLDESDEQNILFDSPDGDLLANGVRLRLRKEGDQRLLTYKKSQKHQNGIAYREEIELEISDFDAAKLIFERLGYQVYFAYEKIRSVYALDDTQIMVDQTPIGDFVEIEGADEAAIHAAAEKIGVSWEERTDKSYQQVFTEWAAAKKFAGRNMLFSEIPAELRINS